jgi:hypothetical protein
MHIRDLIERGQIVAVDLEDSSKYLECLLVALRFMELHPLIDHLLHGDSRRFLIEHRLR